MTGETSPMALSAEQIQAQHLDDAFILDTYGFGPAEADTVVSFNGHTGTMRAMLADDRCPVGRTMALGYQEAGLPGVEAKLNALRDFVPDFKVEISDQTRDYHAGTRSREEVLAKPDQASNPDFLV